jgi:hypothetical protein
MAVITTTLLATITVVVYVITTVADIAVDTVEAGVGNVHL